jgi:hypothetical protein
MSQHIAPISTPNAEILADMREGDETCTACKGDLGPNAVAVIASNYLTKKAVSGFCSNACADNYDWSGR